MGKVSTWKDKNNQKDIVGSLMVHPLDWLSVGGSL